MLDYYSMINYREVLYKKEVHYIIAIVDNLLQAYKKISLKITSGL